MAILQHISYVRMQECKERNNLFPYFEERIVALGPPVVVYELGPGNWYSSQKPMFLINQTSSRRHDDILGSKVTQDDIELPGYYLPRKIQVSSV